MQACQRVRFASLALVGLVLAPACSPAAPAGAPKPSSRPRPEAATASSSPAPSSGPASEAPASGAMPAIRPSAAPSPAAPSLPLRLGWLLPRALVGQAAQARLAGEGGLVAPPLAQLLALADGSIVSQGGGILSNNGGTLVSNNGGSALAGSRFRALARRLMQGPSPYEDPRLYLWLNLAQIDFNDQHLQNYAKAKPRLGEWRRFGAQNTSFLPLPEVAGTENNQGALLEASLRKQAYAGHMALEEGRLRLRIVALPSEGAPIRDGQLILDLQAEGEGKATARTRYIPLLERIFNLEDSAASVELAPGQGLSLRLGAKNRESAPDARNPFTAQSLPVGSVRLLVRIQRPDPNTELYLVQRSIRTAHAVPLNRLDLTEFAYAPADQGDRGLAYRQRFRSALPGEQAPFLWEDPFTKAAVDGQGPPPPWFVPPGGQPEASYGEAGKPTLLPPYDAARMEAGFLPIPGAGENPALDPEVRLEAIPEAILQAPESSADAPT